MQTPVRFLFGDETVEITSGDPTLTVLDWLRLQRQAMGTKEGCAEGDCGACTVIVGRLTPQGLRYEAINACIRFLPTLAGCQLLTVEHLKRPDGSLHPVQQAMVEAHGSQCGFCTPGIVMSLVALWLEEADFDTDRIEEALAGNLCRCTGYAPILKAALAVRSLDRTADPLFAGREAVSNRLAALAERGTIEVGDGTRRFLSPATVETLAVFCQQYPEALLVAGATDVGLWVTKQLQQPNMVIALNRIPELQRVTETDDAIRFGAMVPHSEVRRVLARLSPQLDELMRRFGGQQVRNAGTIGGNIANGSPIGDLPPALIALGATLHLRCGEAQRALPLEQFFLDYRKQDRQRAEFVEAITVPKPGADALLHVSKISKRFDEDISALCGAFLIRRDEAGRVTEARLAFGGMAGIPKRAIQAEQALIGRPFDSEAAAQAAAALAQDFTPLSDMRASAAYRLTVAGNLIRRFALEAGGTAHPTRVAGLVGQGEVAHG